MELNMPLAYFRGRLFQVGEPTQADENFIVIQDVHYALEEILTPVELESVFFERQSDAIERFQAEFMRQRAHTEFESARKVAEQMRQNSVLSLIVEKILPVITAELLEKKIESMVTERPAQHTHTAPRPQTPVPESRVVARIKQQLIEEIEHEYSRYGFPVESVGSVAGRLAGIRDLNGRVRDDSALGQAARSLDLLITPERVYKLSTAREFLAHYSAYIEGSLRSRISRFADTTDPSRILEAMQSSQELIEHSHRSRIMNKLSSMKLNIEGCFTLPLMIKSTREFQDVYAKALERKLKIRAVLEDQSRAEELRKATQEQQRLEEIARMQNYERNGAGFMQYNGQYYAYVTTPPYALKSPHISGERCYVEFPPAKVGVSIQATDYGSRQFMVGWPVVFGPYKHPFVEHNDGRGAYQICFGSWSPENRTKGMTPERKVVALLDHAKKTLMMGYITGAHPYNPLQLDRFPKMLTKEEVARKGLVVLNDFGGRR